MTRYAIGILVLSIAMYAGCEKGNTNAAAKAASQAADDTKAAADAKIAADLKAADAAKAASDQAATDTKAAADAKIAADVKAAAVAKAAADQAALDAKNAADARTAAEVKAAAVAKAIEDEKAAKVSALLVKLQDQIQENKLELAQATLTEIDGLKKGSLSASKLELIETSRTALKAKKAAAALLK